MRVYAAVIRSGSPEAPVYMRGLSHGHTISPSAG